MLSVGEGHLPFISCSCTAPGQLVVFGTHEAWSLDDLAEVGSCPIEIRI